MLPIDLEAFGRAAAWARLPTGVASRNFQSTAQDVTFPGALLPAVDAAGRPYWYAAAATGTQWRQLGPLLVAYVGPTVTDFTGRATPPDEAVEAERLLQDCGLYALAKLVPGEDCLELATVALERMRSALANRPPGSHAIPEPTSSLLSRVEMSLAAGARQEAQLLLDQLRSELRLDTLNLHFLEVQIRAAFREWREIVNAEWFEHLCAARKPAAVAGLMLEALWHAHLAPHEGSPTDLKVVYRTQVERFARTLLPQAPQVAAGIAGRFREFEAPAKVEVRPPGAAAQDLLDQAAEAPSVPRMVEARDAVDGLSSQARDTLVHSAAGQQALEALAWIEGPLPTDWPSWLAALTDTKFDNAAAVAREGVEAWSATPIPNAASANAFASSLVDTGLMAGTARDRLLESLPSLVRWVKADAGYPRREMAAIYVALLQLFSLLERRDTSTREAAADLLDAVLTVGTFASEYRELLTDFGALVDEGAGESSVYWLVDLAAILLYHPSPDENAKLILLNRILDSVQPVLGRFTPGQRAAYDRIANSAGWPTLPAPVGADARAGLAGLAGKSVAIYTLTESAGRQAEAALQSMVSGLRVELAHDHVASPRLERLSRDADMFVLSSASAKHAATDCIKANRGEKPLLHAAGRGFSSIVRALEEYAQRGSPEN